MAMPVWGVREELTMKLVKGLLARLGSDTTGATAIEYGLMAALISIAAITAMGSLGNALVNSYQLMSNDMATASTGNI